MDDMNALIKLYFGIGFNNKERNHCIVTSIRIRDLNKVISFVQEEWSINGQMQGHH